MRARGERGGTTGVLDQLITEQEEEKRSNGRASHTNGHIDTQKPQPNEQHTRQMYLYIYMGKSMRVETISYVLDIAN